MTKRNLLLAAVIAVVVAGGIVAVVLSTRSGDSVQQPCGIPASIREQPVSARTSPDGVGIEVVDRGFSSSGLASVGVVLRNSSEHIAYRTRLTLNVFFSFNGAPKGPLQGSLMTMEIPIMLPRQQVGLGRPLVQVDGNNFVTSADVDLKTTTWLPAGALGGFTPVADTYESTTRLGLSPPADSVRYRENSANCRALASRRTGVVFRDGVGRIVGGDLVPPDGKGNPAGSAQHPPASPSCSPGQRTTWIVPLSDIPKDADDNRTELYSLCDLNAPQPDINQVF